MKDNDIFDLFACEQDEEQSDVTVQWLEQIYDMGLPLEPCACCGIAEKPQGIEDWRCPVCGWSDEDDELTLWQARLNFQTFGAVDPMKMIEGDQENGEFSE